MAMSAAQVEAARAYRDAVRLTARAQEAYARAADAQDHAAAVLLVCQDQVKAAREAVEAVGLTAGTALAADMETPPA